MRLGNSEPGFQGPGLGSQLHSIDEEMEVHTSRLNSQAEVEQDSDLRFI